MRVNLKGHSDDKRVKYLSNIPNYPQNSLSNRTEKEVSTEHTAAKHSLNKVYKVVCPSVSVTTF